MKTSTTLFAAACLTVLAGCATNTPAGSGDTVRAIVASQTIAPEAAQSHPGSAAGTAILAYKNYQGSFAAPAPQVEISIFGKK